MTEPDRFERRLAASLVRLADEVPTSVDAHELAATVAAREERRAGWSTALGAWVGRRWSGAQVAAAFVVIPLLAIGLLVLGQRQEGEPLGIATSGRLECFEPLLATAAASAPLVLECTSEVPEELAAGAVRMSLGAAETMTRAVVRTGAIELRSDGATWIGDVSLRVAPNGMAVGDALLAGSGSARGATLHLHLVSADGATWGLLGDLSGPAGTGAGQ